MIVIAQIGEIGKTNLLFDMHKLRKQVFYDRMKWPVNVDAFGLETDEFDTDDTVYILSVNPEKKVQGSWRIRSSTLPTMIECLWPQFLTSMPLPKSEMVWEASRFSILPQENDKRFLATNISYIAAELFCGLTELCLYLGITDIFTLYDIRIEKLIRRLDCCPIQTSDKHLIDGIPVQTGRFKIDITMLDNLRKSSSIQESLIDIKNLPPMLFKLKESNIHNNNSLSMPISCFSGVSGHG